MAKVIKNKSGQNKVYGNVDLADGQSYSITDDELDRFRTSSALIDDLNGGLAEIWDSSASSAVKTGADGVVFLNDRLSYVDVTEQNPFGKPLYRTKCDASESLITIAPNSSQTTYYYLTEDRSVYGGTLIVKNAELGDWIRAYVNDSDGVIPLDYRESLCEDYPVVAEYISRKHVQISNGDITCMVLDYRPLIAKVTAGLYLVVEYHAVNTGVDRMAYFDYDMLKDIQGTNY